jgi:hypothetical protein
MHDSLKCRQQKCLIHLMRDINDDLRRNRFEKYGNRLFTFLHHDGVPWNNNNAEHAVHHFAKLRRFTDGTFTQPSLEKLLVTLTGTNL